MDLITMKEILDEKESEKNKLIGKSEIYLENLKKLGFKDINSATKGLDKLITDLENKKAKQAKSISSFKKKYEDLINA